MNEKIGLTFHEKLKLGRPRISEVLKAFLLCPGASNTELRTIINLGTNMIKAFPRLAQGCGLISKNRKLTEFGSAAVENDLGLDSRDTLWLMHFYLVSPNGPGPEFWNLIFNQNLRIGQIYTVSDLTHLVRSAGIGTDIQESAVHDALSAMLGFYTSRDGLGPLEIIRGNNQEGYQCNHTFELPSVEAFAFMVACCWKDEFAGQTTVELAQFEERSKLLEILKLSRDQLRAFFISMAEKGLCNVYLSAPPYQIVKTWQSHLDILEKVYDQY